MLEAIKPKLTKITAISESSDFLILETENGLIKLEPITDHIVRVVYTLKETFSQAIGLGIVPKQKIPEWHFTESVQAITLTTLFLKLVIDKGTSSIAYYDSNNLLLTKEPGHGGKTLMPYEAFKTLLDEDSVVEKVVTPDGIKEVVREAKKAFDQILYHTRLEFEWMDGEALYGLGQQEEGVLNLRGSRQYVHQANMKIAMPMLVSTRNYGVLMDTYSPLIFSDDVYGSYLYAESVYELDFYFIHGETFDQIIKGYRELTGKATMLPQWAFGFMQSQERFETQAEIIETIEKYRQLQIPIDSIVLDWQSWEDGLWGQKTFDETRFPNARQMTDELHNMGANFMISIWPNMVKESENFKQMKAENCLFQQSETYNPFDPKARQLYWDQTNKGLFSKGIDAWWCDSSEAFTPEWNLAVKPEPDQNMMAFHNVAKVYMPEIYTNAFPLMHAKAIYEGQRSTTDEKRVVNLTRSGYTGAQKFGTIFWSGDTCAKWQTFRNQIPAGLNFCATGLPYWTVDIGAFFVKKGHMWFWDGEYEGGCSDLGYQELYTRWYQWGAFLPIFRAHGTDARREIWHYGQEGDLFYDVLAKFTKLRYALMPYIYSLAGMVTQKDDTMLRLLAFDFKMDSKVLNIKDQYMFGRELMICPVTTPMYYEAESKVIDGAAKTRDVYLPSGVKWYDFWTNACYEGGQTIQANAPIEIMPIYVKAGAIIPMSEVAQHTGALSDHVFELVIYPGVDGTFTLYQDEKNNYNYEKGEYSTIQILWEEESRTLKLLERQGKYSGMPETMLFSIHLIGEENKTIVYNNEIYTIGL